jgi:hypothetical protein
MLFHFVLRARMHKSQFVAMKLPPNLWNLVYAKFLAERFDALESMQVELVEEEGFRVVSTQNLDAGKDVWILDHLWTTTLKTGLEQLRTIEGLVDRLWTLADMDRRLKEEREEAIHERNEAATLAAAAATTSGAGAGGAASASPEVELDEGILATIMSEGHVSRARAIEAYKANKGDLINSITWLAGPSEDEVRMNRQVEEMVAAQGGAGSISPDKEAGLPPDPDTLSDEEKIPILWEGLFKYGLVGSYFTTLATDVTQASLKPEDVQTTIYVNDEIGSAVGQANDANNANAIQAPLCVVTLGGVGFSLMWMTKDVAVEKKYSYQKGRQSGCLECRGRNRRKRRVLLQLQQRANNFKCCLIRFFLKWQ